MKSTERRSGSRVYRNRICWALIIGFVAAILLSNSAEAETTDELIAELREYFSITYEEATNEVLGNFLAKEDNLNFAKAILQLVKHGQSHNMF